MRRLRAGWVLRRAFCGGASGKGEVAMAGGSENLASGILALVMLATPGIRPDKARAWVTGGRDDARSTTVKAVERHRRAPAGSAISIMAIVFDVAVEAALAAKPPLHPHVSTMPEP